MLCLKKCGGIILCVILSLTMAACARNESESSSIDIEESTALNSDVTMQDSESSPAAESQQAPSSPPSVEMDTQDTVSHIVSDMSLYDKICQLLVVTPESLTGQSPVTVAGDTTMQALQNMPVGGILYSKQNFVTQSQVKDMLAKIQSYSKIPLILTCDEEGGRVNRLMDTVGTTYIGPMLDYKDQGADTAYQNAYTIASDMASLGFNFDMAPVADVWSNPDNTVIGDRAYSDDFQQAASLVSSAVHGFHAGGIGTALKHFPGHGDTSADSHFGAVYITKTLEELRENELLPFKAGIDAGSDMVMMGHLIISDVDDQPAPFSYKIVTELLRNELGFDGVIITDGLQMDAMTEYYSSGEIACKAILAGVDMLLCPENPQEAITALQNAVENGDISEQRIDESVERILAMKAQRGMLQKFLTR